MVTIHLEFPTKTISDQNMTPPFERVVWRIRQKRALWNYMDGVVLQVCFCQSSLNRPHGSEGLVLVPMEEPIHKVGGGLVLMPCEGR